MTAHRFKKVAPASPPPNPKQYRPADAVREFGDEWTFAHVICENLSNTACLSLRENGPDWQDASAMRLMERGMLPRVEI